MLVMLVLLVDIVDVLVEVDVVVVPRQLGLNT